MNQSFLKHFFILSSLLFSFNSKAIESLDAATKALKELSSVVNTTIPDAVSDVLNFSEDFTEPGNLFVAGAALGLGYCAAKVVFMSVTVPLKLLYKSALRKCLNKKNKYAFRRGTTLKTEVKPIVGGEGDVIIDGLSDGYFEKL